MPSLPEQRGGEWSFAAAQAGAVAAGVGGSSAGVPPSYDQRIDGLLTEVRWSSTAITYSDPDAAADYQAGYIVDYNQNGTSAQNELFFQISADQRYALHFALDTTTYTQPAGAAGFSVEGFTNLAITYSGPGSSDGTIRVANTLDNLNGATIIPSDSIEAGDVWLGFEKSRPPSRETIAGTIRCTSLATPWA